MEWVDWMVDWWVGVGLDSWKGYWWELERWRRVVYQFSRAI